MEDFPPTCTRKSETVLSGHFFDFMVLVLTIMVRCVIMGA